jgi:hypothetical protein
MKFNEFCDNINERAGHGEMYKENKEPFKKVLFAMNDKLDIINNQYSEMIDISNRRKFESLVKKAQKNIIELFHFGNSNL